MSDKSEIEAIRTVKRYTQPCVQQQLGPEFKVAEVPLFESAKGKWVLFTDYDALLAERDAARADLKEAVGLLRGARQLLEYVVTLDDPEDVDIDTVYDGTCDAIDAFLASKEQS